MMVLAGPGSGKTLVITHRTKILIEHYGIEPHKILVITFTKAAATEMKHRFQTLMDGQFSPVQFGTFHAIFFSILKHAYHYSANNILREEQKKQFLRSIVDHIDMELEDENEFISDMESEISLVKGELLSLEHYYPVHCSKEIFQQIFEEYNACLQRHNLIDFDDMMVYCYELFKQRPDILAKWQAQFSYILIDEFQDINKVQYEIIQMLAKPENNLFIVGDDDQSIYRFRGAKPEIMLQFETVYPNTKRVLLDTNYRSTKCIVDTASKVIRHNKKRFQKKITTSNPQGETVKVTEFETATLETIRVVEEIQKYREAGILLSEIAVLFRTNTQPRTLISKLMEYNIPFQMKEILPNIYEHWIAKNIIAYLKIAMGERDRGLFLQIANRPKRYLNREAFDTPYIDFEQLYLFYEDKNWMLERIDRLIYDIKAIAQMKPYAAINYIRKAVGYDTYLTEYAEYRHMKASDLFDILDELQEASRPFHSFQEWFSHMEEYANELKEQRHKKQQVQEDCVSLVTMHGSKGLEYEVVFIIDANEGITPHRKAVLEEDLEEERRMFYVAMTRAKTNLHIYFSKERNNKELEPSRFLLELLEGEIEENK